MFPVNSRTEINAESNEEQPDNPLWFEPSTSVPEGTPIAPFAATGPRQYAEQKWIRYNESVVLEIWERCTSVKGEPTRNTITDGQYGRSNKTVYIPQMRRMSPGWNGCRGLTWKIPYARSDHYGIYVDKYDILFLYGGVGYDETEERFTRSKNIHIHNNVENMTYKTRVLEDFWTLSVNNCIHNCSNHGVCTNGFCKCDPGYYGIDCSNYTCPGSVCFYDEEDNQQHCTHCCHDG